MGFTVVHPLHSQTLWAPVLGSETVFMGSIIGFDDDMGSETIGCGGVRPLPVAAGAMNLTNLDIPMGVVTGTNVTSGNINFDTTQKEEYITAAADTAIYGNTTNYTGVEGPWAKGDRIAMVQYIPITSETVLRGPIWNAAVGTAITAATVSTACGGDGLDCTTNAVQCTPVAYYATMYWRTGANRGTYRILSTTSTTVHEWAVETMATTAVGDTVVVAPLRPFGRARAYIDAEGLYIDGSAAITTNYLMIDVLRLDLSEAGGEYVEFRFAPENFMQQRQAVHAVPTTS